MNEPIEELVSEPVQEPKRNRGWFGPQDHRINLEGRPKGRRVAAPDGTPPVDCAKRADRVKLVFVRGPELAYRLGRRDAPWAVNLPPDCEVVDCRFDADRGGVVLTIRSKTFPRIARGSPIPEFIPFYDGLRCGRHWGPDGEYRKEYVGGAVVFRPTGAGQSRGE